MEINLSYDQLNNEYSMLMSLLEVSVSKHLLDDHFTCVWANDGYYDMIRYPKSVYEELFHNHPDEYFHNNPEGWKLLTAKTIADLERGEKSGTVYLPMLYPDGQTFWVKLQSIFTDEYINGFQVAYTTMTDVTEMMQAKQEQQHTQQIVEKMMQEQDMLMSALNVSVSKHVVDEHFTCIRANEYYYKLIDYTKEKYEALFHNHPDEYYRNNPEGWALLTQKVTETLEQGKDMYETLVPMKKEDGSSYWVQLYNYFTDEYIDGYRASYTVMTDVTELVQMRNEQEILMRAMKVSISRHLVDEHFTLIGANEFYYRLIGYTQAEYEELYHNHCDKYFEANKKSWYLIRERIEKMHETGDKSYEIFVPLKIRDGSTRWVKMVGFFTVEFQDGKQLAYTTMVDVTDMMQIQQEKAIAYDNIPGFIVKHQILPDKIMMIDASDRIKDIFDIDVRKLVTYNPYNTLLPESRIMIENNHPHFRNGEPFEGTIQIKDKHDRTRWFHIHCTCIDHIADDPLYLTVFIDITDITELRKLQKQLEERTELLNTALEAAKQANAAKSDFLSRMSHDIRTPMNAIVGMTEIAGKYLSEPKRVQNCLQKIHLSSRHLLSLINDVLDMSKIENGSFPINMDPLFLPEVLHEVIMITLTDVRSRRQRFDVHLIELEQEYFVCDALRLRQILLNLLSNACKFTPEGGHIVLDVEQAPGDTPDSAVLHFTVSDNGIGIKPEFLDHIFDAFTREKDSRTDRIEGSGLGMAITKRLVDLLGGTIEVHSQPESGTTFRIALPVQFSTSQRIELTVPSASLLLIDKDPVILKHGSQTLGMLGVVTDCTSSTEEAVSMISARHQARQDYDLVILDRDMLVPDDLEAIGHLRKEPPGSLPLLILSAYDHNEFKDQELIPDVDDLIEKPLFSSTLRDCLLKHLAGHTPPQQKTMKYDFGGKTFLLVEDNAINREIAVEMLRSLGASMETAVNGKEAVQNFEKSAPGHYAMILMDVQMPEMNGYDATHAIRTLPRSDAKTIPIIAMTADAFVEDIQRAEAAGMNGHMAKPLDLETMARKVSKYLCEHESEEN